MSVVRRAVVPLLAAAVAVLLSAPAGAVTAPEGRAPAPSSVHHALPRATPTPTPVVHRAVPAHSGSGRRIVYSERLPQHIWLVGADGRVVRDFAASGRANWPVTGTYRVYSKSARSSNTRYGVTFRWMVRFTVGHSSAIGFHSIPRYYDGRPMQSVAQLGQAVGKGGCPHSADADAKFLYDWAGIGTTVVVVR